jgi:hypothetical protein
MKQNYRLTIQIIQKSSKLFFFALLVILPCIILNGCATKPKSLVVAFPGYMELPAQSSAVATMDFGSGAEKKEIKTDRIYYCYDDATQVDVLAVKKGK